jgi:hypothetical protein
MNDLLKKLNYKEHRRIAVLNAADEFIAEITRVLDRVIIDREIDQRCPYEFMIVFVSSVAEVENFTPSMLHNLTADGILWFCYPKKTSKFFSGGPERDRGWKSLNDAGFHGIRMVAVDKEWSALRFRNIKYIKSSTDRFAKQ